MVIHFVYDAYSIGVIFKYSIVRKSFNLLNLNFPRLPSAIKTPLASLFPQFPYMVPNHHDFLVFYTIKIPLQIWKIWWNTIEHTWSMSLIACINSQKSINTCEKMEQMVEQFGHQSQTRSKVHCF